jgi:hypothetical protein
MKLLPSDHKVGQLWRLLRSKRHTTLSHVLTDVKRSFRLINTVDGAVAAVEDISPPTKAGGVAAKSFWKNAFMFGIRRYRQEIPTELFFLTLIVTVNGVNNRVARQINYLFSYISRSKPHGFVKQLKVCTRLCKLLS